MQARILSLWTAITGKWKSLERKHRRIIALSALGFIVVLGIAVIWVASPKYVRLTSASLPPYERAMLEGALKDRNIPFRKSRTGTGIDVPEKHFLDAAAIYSMSDAAVATENFTLANAIASVGMTTTSKMQDEVIYKTRCSEIAQMLKMYDGVVEAIVSYELPSAANYWLSDDREGTASVVLKTSKQLTRKDGERIANAVAGRFIDLRKENVNVTDNNGNILYSGVSEDAIEDAAGYRREFENYFKNEVRRGVSDLLSMFGKPNISLNFKFDYSTVSKESVQYENPRGQDEAKGFPSIQSIEKASGTTSNSDGAPGLDTNNLETPNYLFGNNMPSEYSQSSEQAEYLYDVIRTVTDSNNTGTFLPDESSVAVTFNIPLIYREDDITEAQLNSLSWRQFKDLNDGIARPIEDPTLVTAVTDLVKIGTGVENVKVLIFHIPQCIDKEVRTIPYETIIMLVILGILVILLFYGMIRKAQPDEVTEIEPELSVEDLLVSTQLEEEKEGAAQKLMELRDIEFQEDSDIKKKIIEFVTEKPEAVAQLLKNWINEDEWD